MAEIDILLDDHELHTLDDDLRQPWPETGMACEVPGCNTNQFTNFRTYINHWKKFHVMNTTVVFCQKCKKSYSRRHDLSRHLQTTHKLSQDKAIQMLAEAKTKKLNNIKYINPGDLLPRKK